MQKEPTLSGNTTREPRRLSRRLAAEETRFGIGTAAISCIVFINSVRISTRSSKEREAEYSYVAGDAAVWMLNENMLDQDESS